MTADDEALLAAKKEKRPLINLFGMRVFTHALY
jgi:hypothetical protein